MTTSRSPLAAGYVHLDNRDMVESISYGNGTKVEYQYDNADRLTQVLHSYTAGGVILQLDYFYDDRNLITSVIEYDETPGVFSTTTYDYDARRRLINESRTHSVNGPLYNLDYTYDPGGNRTTKVDVVNGITTTYQYDVDAPSTYNHSANRLMYYEAHDDATADLLERVEYEYAIDGDAAGNVTQVIRMIPDNPALPADYDVFGTHLTYRKNGELRIVTQRFWRYENDAHQPSTVLKIREFRGDGRARHMIRERDTETLEPLYATAVWTDYDGDTPTGDYTVSSCIDEATIVEEKHYEPGIAEIEYGPDFFDPTDETVTYTHTNHLGTTRARTDDSTFGGGPGSPAPIARPVYTAFGERVGPDGTIGEFASPIGTRYGYVGKEGYETFEPGNASPHYWGEWNGEPVPFGFIHTGARWYDPATGRFLQRDPMGIYATQNVYVYGNSRPTSNVDPTGLIDLGGGGASHTYPVPGLSRQQQLLGSENPGLLMAGGIAAGGGLVVFAAPEGAAAAVIAGGKKLLSKGLRWLNRGQNRLGFSRPPGCQQEYFSLRIGEWHKDLFKMPKWLKDLY